MGTSGSGSTRSPAYVSAVCPANTVSTGCTTTRV